MLVNLPVTPFFGLMPKIQRSFYSVSEKLEVLQYAKLYSLRAASRHFTIDHSMISH